MASRDEGDRVQLALSSRHRGADRGEVHEVHLLGFEQSGDNHGDRRRAGGVRANADAHLTQPKNPYRARAVGRQNLTAFLFGNF